MEKAFFDTLYSHATYVTQCVSNKLISPTGVPDYNIRKATSLGFSVIDFWGASQRGANGEVYDMLRGKWVKLPLNKKWCNFVHDEQKKFKKTLSRY